MERNVPHQTKGALVNDKLKVAVVGAGSMAGTT